jgi:hypothetical protein
LQLQLQAIALEEAAGNQPTQPTPTRSSLLTVGNKDIVNNNVTSTTGTVAQQLYRMYRSSQQSQCIQPILPLIDSSTTLEESSKSTQNLSLLLTAPPPQTQQTQPLATIQRPNGDVLIIPTPLLPPVVYTGGNSEENVIEGTHTDGVIGIHNTNTNATQQFQTNPLIGEAVTQAVAVDDQKASQGFPVSAVPQSALDIAKTTTGTNHFFITTPGTENHMVSDINTKPVYTIRQQQTGSLIINKIVPVLKDDLLPGDTTASKNQQNNEVIFERPTTQAPIALLQRDPNPEQVVITPQLPHEIAAAVQHVQPDIPLTLAGVSPATTTTTTTATTTTTTTTTTTSAPPHPHPHLQPPSLPQPPQLPQIQSAAQQPSQPQSQGNTSSANTPVPMPTFGPQNIPQPLPTTSYLEYTQIGDNEKLISFDPSNNCLGQLLTYRGAYNFSYIQELEDKRLEINRETHKYVTKYLQKHHLPCGILASTSTTAVSASSVWWNPTYVELFTEKKQFKLFYERMLDLAEDAINSDANYSHVKDKKDLQTIYQEEAKKIMEVLFNVFMNIDPKAVDVAKKLSDHVINNTNPNIVYNSKDKQNEPPNPISLQQVYHVTKAQVFRIPLIPPMPLSKKQTVYIQHFNQMAQHIKQVQLPFSLDLLKDVTDPNDQNNWERGFEIKTDTYPEFVALYNSLQSRLLTPDMLSRWREFG